MSFEVFNADKVMTEIKKTRSSQRPFLKPFPGGLVINRMLHEFFMTCFENNFKLDQRNFGRTRYEVDCKLLLDDENKIMRLVFPDPKNNQYLRDKEIVLLRLFSSTHRQSAIVIPTAASYKLQERIGTERCFIKDIQYFDEAAKSIKHIDFHYSIKVH